MALYDQPLLRMAENMTTSIKWQWQSFSEFSNDELYKILQSRQEVFAVEQNCVYLDLDNIDQNSWHLSGWKVGADGGKALYAYLRVVKPGVRYKEPSMGRILTTKPARGSGVGKELVKEALIHLEEIYPDLPIKISAQEYLEKFYADFGFETVSEIYLEDDIPHIEMIKPAA